MKPRPCANLDVIDSFNALNTAGEKMGILHEMGRNQMEKPSTDKLM